MSSEKATCPQCFEKTLCTSSRKGYLAECNSCKALFTEEDLRLHSVSDSVIKRLKETRRDLVKKP